MEPRCHGPGQAVKHRHRGQEIRASTRIKELGDEAIFSLQTVRLSCASFSILIFLSLSGSNRCDVHRSILMVSMVSMVFIGIIDMDYGVRNITLDDYLS